MSDYFLNINTVTGEGFEKLESFILENFKADNIWCYGHHEEGAFSCRIMEDEDDSTLFGLTLEDKIKDIITFIKGEGSYLHLHDSIPNSYGSSVTLTIQIDDGYYDEEEKIAL